MMTQMFAIIGLYLLLGAVGGVRQKALAADILHRPCVYHLWKYISTNDSKTVRNYVNMKMVTLSSGFCYLLPVSLLRYVQAVQTVPAM
jgi:hypothetical protein